MHGVGQKLPGVLVALTSATMLAPPAHTSAVPLDRSQAAVGGGSIGVRLVDAPATTRDDPRARIYIVDHLAPGTVIHRRIEVTNTTGSTAHVLLYTSAANIAKGSFLGAAGHTPNDLSTWTSVQPDAADVPAHGRVMATVTVALPRDAAPGEKYAVVWAEVRSRPASAGSVTEVSRVGIRLYISVGPGGPPAADFTIDSLTAERTTDGRPRVLATVHNTGGRALDMTGNLQLLAGPGGLSAGPFPARLGTTLAIGDREPVMIGLDTRIPAGPWDARMSLLSGLVERSARATLIFPAAGAAHPVIATPTSAGWIQPAIVVVIILVLVLLGLFFVLRRHRSRGTVASPKH